MGEIFIPQIFCPMDVNDYMYATLQSKIEKKKIQV